MADRISGLSSQGRLAAAAASFVLLAISNHALAASGSKIHCEKETQANLEVTVEKLTTKVVDHDLTPGALEDMSSAPADHKLVASRLLAPRAEAAIRDAFQNSSLEEEHPAPDLSTSVLSRPLAGMDSAAKPEMHEAPEADTASRRMNTQLPGVSEDDLSRFKKQMYRRDI